MINLLVVIFTIRQYKKFNDIYDLFRKRFLRECVSLQTSISEKERSSNMDCYSFCMTIYVNYSGYFRNNGDKKKAARNGQPW
jgi:hypothetical protein